MPFSEILGQKGANRNILRAKLVEKKLFFGTIFPRPVNVVNVYAHKLNLGIKAFKWYIIVTT